MFLSLFMFSLTFNPFDLVSFLPSLDPWTYLSVMGLRIFYALLTYLPCQWPTLINYSHLCYIPEKSHSYGSWLQHVYIAHFNFSLALGSPQQATWLPGPFPAVVILSLYPLLEPSNPSFVCLSLSRSLCLELKQNCE